MLGNLILSKNETLGTRVRLDIRAFPHRLRDGRSEKKSLKGN